MKRSDGVQCFDASQAELNYYRHPGQAMLAPPGFPPLHYLNKPLPGLSMEQAQQALEQYNAQGMPDLLPHNMHQTSPSPGSIKSKGSDLRLFKCLTCNKDFKQKSTLLQHERIHTDSRPYGCPECLKRFRQQSHLTQHLRIHANEKVCGFIGHKYTNSNNFCLFLSCFSSLRFFSPTRAHIVLAAFDNGPF